MPRPRFENLEPEKRKAIIDAAAREIATHGYDGASLNAILVSAGLSKGAFYYYFDDKADLFVTVMAEIEREMMEGLRDFQPPTGDGFWSMLHRKLDFVMAEVDARPWLLTIGSVVFRLSDDAKKHPALATLADRFQGQMEAFIAAGQAVGAIRDDVPQSALLALLTAMDRAMSEWLADHHGALSRSELRRFLDTMTEMFERFASPPGPPPEGAAGGAAEVDDREETR